MDEPLVWVGAVLLLLIGIVLIERIAGCGCQDKPAAAPPECPQESYQ